MNKKRARCKIRTCATGPFCWIHTKSLDHLRIKPSKIRGAGKGLYTTTHRGPGNIVGHYTGEHLTKKQVESRYPGRTLGEYTIKVGPHWAGRKYVRKSTWIDARKSNSGNMRYINTCDAPAGTRKACRNNVEFVQVGPMVEVNVCPGRIVKKDAELYVSYGPDYTIGGQKVNALNCG